MRALLERFRSARVLVAAVAALSMSALVGAASAGGDFGLRRALSPSDAAVPARPKPHGARRIWAAALGRPLRVALRRSPGHGRVARMSRPARTRASAEPPVVFARTPVPPKPPRPAVVSILRDRTLRAGDAVMMADGIRLFRPTGDWPYRPREFVRLSQVASLAWHLRATLDDLDRSPPMRWSSAVLPAG